MRFSVPSKSLSMDESMVTMSLISPVVTMGCKASADVASRSIILPGRQEFGVFSVEV